MLLTLSACLFLAQTPTVSPKAPEMLWRSGPASTSDASLSWLASADEVHISFAAVTKVGHERSHAQLHRMGTVYRGFIFLSVQPAGGEMLSDVVEVEIPAAAFEPLLKVMAERPAASGGARRDADGEPSWFSMDAVGTSTLDADRGKFPGPRVHLELPPSSQAAPAAFIINEFGALAIDPVAVKAARKSLMPLLGRQALDVLWGSRPVRR